MIVEKSPKLAEVGLKRRREQAWQKIAGLHLIVSAR